MMIGKTSSGDRRMIISRSSASARMNESHGEVSEPHACSPTKPEREIEHRLFQIGTELRQARQRQLKLEDLQRLYVSILGQSVPLQKVVSHSPTDDEVGVKANLDSFQLVQDASGRFHLAVKGWAWSSETVIAIDLFLDESRWVALDHGAPRHDVRDHFEGPESMVNCGFDECLVLPPFFDLDTKCVLQISDLAGQWTSFEIRPEPQKSRPSLRERWRQLSGELRHHKKRLRLRLKMFRLEQKARRCVDSRLAASGPLVSLVLPVDEMPRRQLRAVIESVRCQIYPNWELLIVPISRAGSNVINRCRSLRKLDPGIHVLPLNEKSIAEAMNAALLQSHGTHAVFLNANVRLTTDALAWVASSIAEYPEAAWLYGDGEIINRSGEFVQSDRKPDFSEPHLWSRFFTRGLSVYRRDELLACGGLRNGFPGAEEYDLVLRLARRVPRSGIKHISEILFKRQIRTSDSAITESEFDASYVAAVRDALEHSEVEATVVPHECGAGVRRLVFSTWKTPPVVIVIPTRNKVELVRRCVESLRSATRYPNYRILVVNNNSTEPELFAYLDEQSGYADFSYVDYNKPFNHSAMHNDVLTRLDAEFAVFLNNDVCGFSDGWLEQLVAAIQLDEQIAGVGPMLLYPDRRVQHGGVIIGLGGGAAHAQLDVPESASGYQGRLHCLQDLSACTAACLLVRLSAFWEIGGFRPTEFPVGFNDVDLWLRLGDAGYRCLYQPAVTAVHYESISRGLGGGDAIGAANLMKDLERRKYRDQFYNPQLNIGIERAALGYERFLDALPPEETRRAQLERLIEQLGNTP